MEPVRPRPCPDDLLALARRRDLSDLERRAIESHLAGCELCRASHAISGLLHPSLEDLPEDGETIARVAARASGALAARSRARPTTRSLALAAGLILCAGTAALAWMGRRAPPPAALPPPPSPAAASGSRPRVPAPSRALAAPSEISATDEAARSPLDSPPHPGRERRALLRLEPKAKLAADAGTAAILFAEANAIRRGGDLRAALQRYRELRARFPGSPEARHSAMSIGDLSLQLGSPRQALAAFDAYLAEAPRGALEEEALFGRARALRSLGSGTEEAKTWRRLLRDFPRSAYEPLGRRRLDELTR